MRLFHFSEHPGSRSSCRGRCACHHRDGGAGVARIVACIETAWRDRVEAAQLYRYEFSDRTFEDLGDAGMWVSREVVTPKGVAFMDSLPALLRNEGVELRPLNDLRALKGVWASSVHASGIRLRNAMDW